MITVYGRATSSNVQAVMWGIAEMGLPCNRLDYGHSFGGLDTSEFRALSPHARVPVIRDGDLAVFESCAILRYLASQYGDGGAFWPTDPKSRARVDMWAEWAKTELCARFTVPIFWPRVRTAAAKRNQSALDQAISDFQVHLARVDDLLAPGQPFLLGSDLTMADIIAGHILYRWFSIDVPRLRFPHVEAWYQRLTDRPAYREHVMVDYSVLADPEAG
ncbi:glutathione S-transferase family protein [Seohaeicola nanhaiensis]|uniref:Glutathione S-transferase family protein n=1 Tax=Seohaeicola nanhaiensis TaxID=1387282 RepID=A0ABV9KBU6_9RHOB